MPRQITKYLCDFKCGTSAKKTLAIILNHEKTCRLNPEAKACSTCVHEEYTKELIEDDFGGAFTTMHRGCKKLDEEAFQELMDNRTDGHTTPPFHIFPVRNCPWHELKK